MVMPYHLLSRCAAAVLGIGLTSLAMAATTPAAPHTATVSPTPIVAPTLD